MKSVFECWIRAEKTEGEKKTAEAQDGKGHWVTSKPC